MPYGTALSPAQLCATATVPGDFIYTPSLNTVESTLGTSQLSVTFTPSDSTYYSKATVLVSLTVTPAVLTVTTANASRVYGAVNPAFTASYSGFVNGDTQTVVSGSPSLTTATTISSPVGSYPITAAIGTLTATNYTFAFTPGTEIVTQAVPVISWPAPATIVYGSPLGPSQLDATSGGIPGTFIYTPAAGTVLALGTHTLSASFKPTDTMNYTSATASVPIDVTGPVISAMSGSSAPAGWTETITGQDFGDAQGDGSVSFGSAQANVISWSNTFIAVSVPSTLNPGQAALTVTAGGKTSIAQPFVVSQGQPICAAAGWITGYDNDQYSFDQNEWNSSISQCAVLHGTGFTLTKANFAQSALPSPASNIPATYPTIFYGCKWGTCTTAPGLPIQESQLETATTSVDTVEVPTGNYDVSYDIWFNQTPTVLPAQNNQPNGAEIMIWINHNGTPVPNGSKVAGSVTIAGSAWDVWIGTEGTTTTWNIVTYVQNTPTSSVKNLDLAQFFTDAQIRQTTGGAQVLNPSWFLIDVEMGFEVWDGGQGLEISNLAVSTTSQ